MNIFTPDCLFISSRLTVYLYLLTVYLYLHWYCFTSNCFVISLNSLLMTLRYNKDNLATRLKKAEARKVVINSPDDEFCPSWLKEIQSAEASLISGSPNALTLQFSPLSPMTSSVSPISPSSMKRRFFEESGVSYKMSPTRSKFETLPGLQASSDFVPLELSIQASVPHSTKVVALGLPPSRYGRTSGLFQYQTALINLITFEVETYKSINKISSTAQTEILQPLHKISKQLIEEIFKELIRYSNIKDALDGDFMDMNLFQLVYNCQIRSVNIGSILNANLLDLKISRFRILIVMYYSQALNDENVDEIYLKPIEKLFKYPELIKNLINSTSGIVLSDNHKSELNLFLLGINNVISSCKRYLNCDNIEALLYEELNQSPGSAKEIKIIGGKGIDEKKPKRTILKLIPRINKESDSNISVKYDPLINLFKTKYQNLMLIKKSFVNYRLELERFFDKQIQFSQSWQGLLDDFKTSETDPYILSMYSSFKEKSISQYTLARKGILKELNLILIPIDSALDICGDIQQHVLKYRSNLKPNKVILEDIPKMMEYMDELVLVLISQLNQKVCAWLKEIIGIRSLKEFQQLKNNDHRDILDFHKKSLRSSISMIVKYDDKK